MSSYQGLIYLAVLIIVVVAIILIAKRRLITKPTDETIPDKDQNLPVIDFSQENTNEQMLSHLIEQIDVGHSKVYQGIYVPCANGNTTVIKLLMSCASGIYVFHYVDIEGWILGREASRWWTHFISTDERKFINNPIWENNDQIADLMAFFPGTEAKHYRSYVIFSDKCELRSIEAEGNTRIVNTKDFARMLEKDMITSDPLFKADVLERLEKVLDVLDKSDQLELRIQDLKQEIAKEQANALEAEKSEFLKISTKRLEVGDILSELTEADRKRIREARHIKKHRPEDRFTRSELALRDSLVIWRKQQASTTKVSVFEIFDNRALDGIVDMKPHSLKELRTIPGFDAERCNTYGKAIINMVEHAPQ